MKNSDKLLSSTWQKYQCLTAICAQAQHQATNDPTGSFVKTISLPHWGQKVTEQRSSISNYFDELQQSLIEFGFIEMVAVFERLVFSQLEKEVFQDLSPSLQKAANKAHSHPPNVKRLLEAKLPRQLNAQLAEIIEHRNWLIHGKRLGSQSTLGLDEVHSILSEILDILGQSRADIG